MEPGKYSVFTHVASIYAKVLEKKKAFTEEKSSTPTELVWNTNMAAVLLFSVEHQYDHCELTWKRSIGLVAEEIRQ